MLMPLENASRRTCSRGVEVMPGVRPSEALQGQPERTNVGESSPQDDCD